MKALVLGRVLLGAALAAVLSAGTVTLAVSATPATITWSGAISDGSSYVFGEVPSAPTCAAADDTGPITCVVTGYATSVGAHVLTATATSADQTTTVATRTYTVQAWKLKGFYSPVKMTGSWNKVKGGANVPLKFKVYQGSTKSKSASAIASLNTQQIDCAGLAPIGTTKPVATGSKATRLKYRSGAFHQNWKTPKAPKPAKVKGKKAPVSTVCYRVTLTTADASSLTALFSLK